MIELNEAQRQELNHPEPTAIDPATKREYVLVRKEVYARLRHLFEDDLAVSKREVAVLVERAMRDYDANDPTLELYQND
jgi:hypothetical protein